MASNKKPHLLNEVMEAIARLKNSHGSTVKKVLEQVETSLMARNNRKSNKNSYKSIITAIKRGVHTGLLKQKNGKLKLGLDAKDYAVYKNIRRKMQLEELSGRAKIIKGRRGSRRRGRKGRRARRGRRRRRMDKTETDGDQSETESERTATSGVSEPNPEDRARRKRRRSRKGRRGGKRRKRSVSSASPSTVSRESTPRSRGSGGRSADRTKKGDETNEGAIHGNDGRREEDAEDSYHQHPNCGNPDCLCNINVKEEMDQDHDN